MYTLATVATNVYANLIAWSTPISQHETREAAELAGNKEYLKLNEATPAGCQMPHTFIIHDGTNCYSL